jgi:hypothetical protein
MVGSRGVGVGDAAQPVEILSDGPEQGAQPGPVRREVGPDVAVWQP